MIVATAAVKGKSHPNRSHCLSLIEDILHPVFGCNAAAFAIDHMVAIETRRQHLFLCRVRQQVARDLFHGKLIVTLIRVERPHYPIAPRPHRAFAITLVAVAVRVARRLQPIPSHSLAVTRRGKQTVDHNLECRFWIFDCRF